MAVLGKGTSEREPDRGRRHFLGRTAMTLAAVRFGGTSDANEREPRQIADFRSIRVAPP